MQLMALVDHQNVPWDRIAISQLLVSSLDGVLTQQGGEANLSVRAYGGWFEGSLTSEERFTASAMYQANLPSLLKIGPWFVRVQFEFADHLYPISGDLQAIGIQYTVRTRASAQLAVPLASPSEACSDSGCEIKKVRRWIKRKVACTRDGCSRQFSSYWVRKEQKQVDTHLGADLIAAKLDDSQDAIVLISDDIDFIPSIATAARLPSRARVAWCRVDVPSSYLDATLQSLGVRVLAYQGAVS